MDCIDTDICLRLRAAGMTVAWVDGVEIEHALGDMAPARFAGRSLRRGGREVRVSHHSDDRRYYMTRNRTILLCEYRRVDRLWYRKAVRSYSKESLASLLFEPRRVRRVVTMAKALRDGLVGRVGRRS
jgi:GT2 family glycosyltransferase